MASKNDDEGINLLSAVTGGVAFGMLAGFLVSRLRRQTSSTPQGVVSVSRKDRFDPQSTQPQPTAGLPKSVSESQPVGSPAMSHAQESTRWSKPTKYLVGVILFLVFVLLLYISRNVLPLVIMAALIAFIVRPIILWMMRWLRLKKTGAVLLTYFLVLILITLTPLVMIPAMLDSFNFLLAIDYKTLATNLVDWVNGVALSVQSQPILDMLIGEPLLAAAETLNSLVSGQPTTAPLNLNLTFETVSRSLGQTFGTLTSVVGPLVSAVVSIMFTVLISVQLAMSWDDAVEAFPKIFPPAYKKELGQLSESINRTWNAFLRGQLTLMLVIGVVTWLGAVLLGAPQPFLLALVAGLLEIIPNLGPFIAGAVGVTLALVFGSSYLPVNNFIFALIVLAFYFLVQMLENQVLVPYIMGDAVDLPPVVVLISVVVFGSAFGVLGVFLATPIIATGRSIFNYLHAKILEPAAVPPEPEPEPTLWDQLGKLGGHIRKLLIRPFTPTK